MKMVDLLDIHVHECPIKPYLLPVCEKCNNLIILHVHLICYSLTILYPCMCCIRESVDLCRDGAYAILKQNPYNFTTNTLKAYLRAQTSSLSAFVISKTHISGQKPRGRQLNANVCGRESAIFSFFLSC